MMSKFLSKRKHIIEKSRRSNHDGDPIQGLQAALGVLLGSDKLTAETALIINNACEKGRYPLLKLKK